MTGHIFTVILCDFIIVNRTNKINEKRTYFSTEQKEVGRHLNSINALSESYYAIRQPQATAETHLVSLQKLQPQDALCSRCSQSSVITFLSYFSFFCLFQRSRRDCSAGKIFFCWIHVFHSVISSCCF